MLVLDASPEIIKGVSVKNSFPSNLFRISGPNVLSEASRVNQGMGLLRVAQTRELNHSD